MIHVVLFKNQSNLDTFLKAEVWQQGHSCVNTFGGYYKDFLITKGNEPMFTSQVPRGVIKHWHFTDTSIDIITRTIIEVGTDHLDWLEEQEQKTAGVVP